MKTKKSTIAFIALLTTFLLSGCGAYYGSEKQHTKGDWYGLAGSGEVAQIKSDRLALAKLEAAPVQILVTNGVIQGYRGIVANLSSYCRCNFTISGPETKSYFLGPGERYVDYLVPGTYTCALTVGGSRVGQKTFHVKGQLLIFLNEQCHWYAAYEGR